MGLLVPNPPPDREESNIVQTATKREVIKRYPNKDQNNQPIDDRATIQNNNTGINLHQYTNDSQSFQYIINKSILDNFYSNGLKKYKYNISEGIDTIIISDKKLINNYLKTFGTLEYLTTSVSINIYNNCLCIIYFRDQINSIVVYSDNLVDIENTIIEFKKHISEISVRQSQEKVYFTWYTILDGRTCEYEKTEYLDDIFHKECYPYINDYDAYINNYLNSTAPILVLMGPPGTGKTRFIRNILKSIAQKETEEHSVTCLYTSSKDIIETGSIYLDLVFNNYDVLVLEDIDYHMSSRRDGNTSLYNLLSVSNGLLVNCMKDKKIILSTNLPNTKNIDEALIRPGRCFDIINTRKLTKNESEIILKLIGKEKDLQENKEYTLADLYN